MTPPMPTDRPSGGIDQLDRGGEMGYLIRAHDWAATPLGPLESWPRSLHSIVLMMVTSRYQMWMAWGPDLTFLYNDAYCPTLGVKHPGALGKPARNVWAEIWPDIGPLIAQVLETGEATYSEAMLLLLQRSGFTEETYHTFSYSPLFDDDGAIAGMFCVVVEETERVINDRRLETLRRLGAAAAAANDEAALFSAIGTELATNTADLPFVLTYLYDQQHAGADLVAHSGIAPGLTASPVRIEATDLVWPIDAILQTAQPVLVTDLADRFATLPHGIWDRPPANALIVPIPNQAEQEATAGVMVVGLNPNRAFDPAYNDFVTLLCGQIGAALARVRAFEAERRRAEALAELDRAKTVFFANVSHEFRTPLTLMLSPLEDALATTEGAVHDQIALAFRNGTRLLRLVNNLLDFSRIEAGRTGARFAPTDLAAFSAEIASCFRAAIERAGLTLQVETPALPAPVYLDREMWEKILFNLLSNAFKFTLHGSIDLTVRPTADGTHAEIRVRDTGIGVPPAEVPRLFERFHRVEAGQGRSIEGSGIGLALVQELVRLHGGTIAVESEPGTGTCFIIHLAFGTAHLPPDQIATASSAAEPRNAALFVEEAMRWLPDQSVPPAMQDGSHPDRARRGQRIILADDNTDMRDYVSRLLTGQGYTVEAVPDGLAALEAARQAPPDLILSDVMMPRLDGFGLLRTVRAERALAGTPVVLLSARAGEEAKIEGLDAGADDYLTKPFAARELLARVATNIQMAMVRREAAREIMRSEQQLLMTRERLDIALATGRVAIFELDVETNRTMVFGPLVAFFGVPEAVAAQGLPLEQFTQGIDPDDRDRVVDAIATAISENRPFEAEYRILGGDAPRHVIARGMLEAGSATGTRLIGAVIDISGEKAAQDELRAQTRAMERLNATLEERIAVAVAERLQAEDALRQAQKMEAVGQLTGGVAHDFNNLLTVIIGGLDTIRRRGPQDNPRVTRALNLATQGAQRAATLTARLLAFSRRQPLDPRPLDLNAVVRDSTELLHRTLGETIELETVTAARLWPVEVDQNQLENAILNLAVNARDAMPGGGKLTIETGNTMLDETYAARDSEVIPGQYAVVSISDSGSGMDTETLGRVFEPFYTTKEVGKGTGLGLSMVYGFVKQSGGHITIYSEPGQGTTVRLYFPRYRGDLTDTAATVAVAPPGGLKEEIILVVEDNDDVRSYSVMMLNELGYSVLEAADSDAAMEIIRTPGRIDLLFTDVVLPGRTGRVLATEAQIIRPDLRVLFTTGYSRNAIVHQGRLDAGVALLTKPFTFDQLATRIRDVLDQPHR
jgi:signal transduction histidine kinase/PleD family two-component response regulator